MARDYEKEVFRIAEVFVVQHDWCAAFGSSLPDDQFRLPNEVCAFEFQVSQRRVIVLAAEVDASVVVTPIVESPPSGWVVPGPEDCNSLVVMMTNQIRAICIALDAEVAVADVQRAPHANSAGKSAYGALPSYRVVQLARRHRPLPTMVPAATGRRRRLHFRRGHWRHFSTFKSWIKWTLVGDPDLGFVDKEYRL